MPEKESFIKVSVKLRKFLVPNCLSYSSDGGNKTSAKLVDLDTEAQLYYCEMWGWRIRIGDLFSADYTPIPPQYLWKKKITKEGEKTNSTAFGVAYQSVLSNITWIDNANGSPFIQKLQRAMNQVNISGKDLSIRFNLDMYESYSRKNTFTTGRITGISFFRLFISSSSFSRHVTTSTFWLFIRDKICLGFLKT